MAKIAHSTYIIDPIFPTRELHIIAGASGSGKSTLMAQIADQLLKGEEVFGYVPNSITGIAYLAFDRSVKGMGRTFERSLQGSETPFPFYSTIDSPEFDKPEHRDPVGAVKRLKELHPEVDVLIVDGLGIAFRGDSAKLNEVATFIHSLVRTLSTMKSELTIFAIHHMAKTKKGNEYAQARAKLHGSVAWAATAETIILVEPESEEDPENPNRILSICPRNAPEKRYTYCFDEYGRLIRGAKKEDPANAKRAAFWKMVLELPPGEMPVVVLKAIAMTLNIPDPTFYRWLNEMVDEGLILSKVRRGVYARLRDEVN